MKKITLFFISLLAFSIFSEETIPFQHNLEGTLPWTNENFDASKNKFTFAIFSDLAGGEREGIFEVAVEQLNLLRPEFVLNVGDLIDDTRYRSNTNKKWDSFNSIASKIEAPIFYVGGNNDLSNKIMKEEWKRKYGTTYYYFIYKDVLFLIMDTEDYLKEPTNLFSLTPDALISGDIGKEQKEPVNSLEGTLVGRDFFGSYTRYHIQLTDGTFFKLSLHHRKAKQHKHVIGDSVRVLFAISDVFQIHEK